MIKACIFDLDGTLANTLESMAYVANEILEKLNNETDYEKISVYSAELERISGKMEEMEMRWLELQD